MSIRTLHRTLDMQVRGEHVDNETEVLVRLCSSSKARASASTGNVHESASSSGTGSSMECDSLEKHISQVVATCVITAFTQKSRYQVSAVPAI